MSKRVAHTGGASTPPAAPPPDDETAEADARRDARGDEYLDPPPKGKPHDPNKKLRSALARTRARLFADKRNREKGVTLENHRYIIGGHVPQFREIAGQFLDVFARLLENIHNNDLSPYDLYVSTLLGTRDITFTFERQAEGGIAVKDLKREQDGIKMRIAVNMDDFSEMMRYLNPGHIAYLVIQAFADKTGPARLTLRDVMSPKGSKAPDKRLLALMLKEAEAIFKSPYPDIAALQASLRDQKIPEALSEALTAMQATEEDIKHITEEVTNRRVSFTVIENDHIREGDIIADTIRKGDRGDMILIYQANKATCAELTPVELCQLLARGLILERLYEPERLKNKGWTRGELSDPIVAFKKTYYYSLATGEFSEMRELVGRLAGEWLANVEVFFDTLHRIGNTISSRPQGRLLPPAKLTDMLRPQRGGDVIKGLNALAKLKDFIVTADGRLKERARVLIYGKYNDTLEIRLPPQGLEEMSLENLFAIFGSAMVEAGFFSRDAAAFLNLWFTYGGLSAAVTEASGVSIAGRAPRDVCQSAARSMAGLFSLSQKGYFSVKGPALRAWLKAQKVIVIEQIEPVTRKEVTQEAYRFKPDPRYKKKDDRRWGTHWATREEAINEVTVIPAEKGLVIIVSGKNPSPIQWDAAFTAAYLSNDRPFKLTLDNGKIGSFSGAGGLDKFVKDYIEELYGRRAPATLGAEENPRWISEPDAVLKGRYVEALRWMRGNRGDIPPFMFPLPADSADVLTARFRAFSLKFHPDHASGGAEGREAELFREGLPHWKVLRGLAVGAKGGEDANGGAVAMTAAGTGDGVAMTAGPARPVSTRAKVLAKTKAGLDGFMRKITEARLTEEAVESALIELAWALDVRDVNGFVAQVKEGRGEFHELVRKTAGRERFETFESRMKEYRDTWSGRRGGAEERFKGR